MTDSDRVSLSVPARWEFARTVRLVAAELATRVGMSIDEVEDVRLAVEEAFVYSVGRVADRSLDCSFTVRSAAIELEIGPLPSQCPGLEAGDASGRYARFILDAMCDEFELAERDDGCYVRLVKRMA